MLKYKKCMNKIYKEEAGMKALVSDEFYHIMECISDKDYDADQVLTTMKQFIPAFAE